MLDNTQLLAIGLVVGVIAGVHQIIWYFRTRSLLQRHVPTDFPEIEKRVLRNYVESPTNMRAFCQRAKSNDIPVQVKTSSIMVNGKIDYAGRDYILMYGNADDVVSIPYTSINMLRAYNEQLDAAYIARDQDNLMDPESAARAEIKRQMDLIPTPASTVEDLVDFPAPDNNEQPNGSSGPTA